MLAIGLAICACMLVSGGRWGVLRTFKWDHAKSSSGDPIWRSDLEIWRCETAGIQLAFVDVVGHAYGTVQSREPSMSCRSLVPRATRLTKAGRDKSRNETPHQSPCSTQTHRRLTAPSLSCPFDPVDVPAVRTETRAAHTKIVSLVPIRY